MILRFFFGVGDAGEFGEEAFLRVDCIYADYVEAKAIAQ